MQPPTPSTEQPGSHLQRAHSSSPRQAPGTPSPELCGHHLHHNHHISVEPSRAYTRSGLSTSGHRPPAPFPGARISIQSRPNHLAHHWPSTPLPLAVSFLPLPSLCLSIDFKLTCMLSFNYCESEGEGLNHLREHLCIYN